MSLFVRSSLRNKATRRQTICSFTFSSELSVNTCVKNKEKCSANNKRQFYIRCSVSVYLHLHYLQQQLMEKVKNTPLLSISVTYTHPLAITVIETRKGKIMQ